MTKGISITTVHDGRSLYASFEFDQKLGMLTRAPTMTITIGQESIVLPLHVLGELLKSMQKKIDDYEDGKKQ